jgi:threonine/homoserine efflux transporter RhtA
MTSVFYYLAVKYIPVSIGIVLLMQTVWMGVLLEMILKHPQNKKVISVFIVLIGTVLATNLINNEVQLDWHGIMWGMLAAASFTTTMFTANSALISLRHSRSLYVVGWSGVFTFRLRLKLHLLTLRFLQNGESF